MPDKVKPRYWLLLIISFSALALAHWRFLENPFLHDDVHSINDNPHIRILGNVPRFFIDPSLFSQDKFSAMYRPVLMVTYALNWAISKGNPWSYRLLNLCLHTLNVLLLIIFLRRFMPTKSAFAAGLLFMLHPFSSRTFLLVSSRSALLMMMWLLICLIAYEKLLSQNGARKAIWFAISFLACGLGMLSVDAAVVIPGFVLMLQIAREKVGRAGLLRTLPFFALVPAYIVLRKILMGVPFGGDYVRSLSINAAMQLKVFFIYIKMLLFPIDYALAYPVAEPISGFEAAVILAAVGLLVWLIKGLKNLFFSQPDATQLRFDGFLLLWPLLAALPYAAVPLNVPVAEHHFYVAFAGIAAWLAKKWVQLPFFAGEKRKQSRFFHVLATCSIVAAICFVLITYHRDEIWSSSFRLSSMAVRLAPESSRAWNELGATYMVESRHEKAEKSYLRALSLEPGDAGVIYNHAINYFYMERYADSIEEMLKYRGLLKGMRGMNYEDGIIGMAYARLNRPRDALPFLDSALELDPARREVLIEKARMLLLMKRPDEAVVSLNALVSTNPRDTEALYWRAEANLALSRYESALADVRAIRALLPRGGSNPEIDSLEANILRKQGNLEQALVLVENALASAESGKLWSLKGSILEEMGRKEEAVDAYRRALSLPLPEPLKARLRDRIAALGFEP